MADVQGPDRRVDHQQSTHNSHDDVATQRGGAQRPAPLTSDPAQLQANNHGVRLAGAGQTLPQKLPPEQRALLIRETDNNLSSAYTSFSNATHNQRAAIKSAADDSSEFVLALIEVGLGLALPGLGRLASCSLKALAGAPSAAALVTKIVTAPEFGGLVTGITKSATLSIKGSLPQAQQFGSDDAFLMSLQKTFGDAKSEIQGRLPTMTDSEIAAVCVRFDRAVANEETYGAKVNEMVMTMRALAGSFKKRENQWGGGRAEIEHYHWTETDLIVNVGTRDAYQTNPLVICEELHGGTPSGTPSGYHFKRRIPETMRSTAIQMAQKKAGHPPQFVHQNDLRVKNIAGAPF